MALWVFGYGSLMWRPGFAFSRVVRARLTGYRRCFCIYSVHHRGVEARPGLVLGLDRGGICDGLAFRVGPGNEESTLAYLREREQVNGVYREARVEVDIIGPGALEHQVAENDRAGAGARTSVSGQRVSALTYLVERAHPSFAGQLPLAVQARIIRGARGLSGNNMAYLANTLAHLRSLGIREREIERLGVLVGSAVNRSGSALSCDCPKLHGMTSQAARYPVRHKRLKRDQRRRFLYRKALLG